MRRFLCMALIGAALPAGCRIAAPEREPWPWELPPRAWPEPVRTAWTALQRRVSIDVKDAAVPDLLKEISCRIGHPIGVDGVVGDEVVSFKVKDMVAEGALRLLLQSLGMDFRIREDGAIVVAAWGELDAVGPDRDLSGILRQASELEAAVRWKGPSRPLTFAEEALAKRIREPEGDLRLEDYLAALRDASGASLLLDATASDEPAARARAFMRIQGRGRVDTLDAHLRRLPAEADLVPMPTLEGAVLLAPAKSAAEWAASPERLAQRRVERALDGPFDGSGIASVPQLVRRLEKVLGAPVLATQAAWESEVVVTAKPGQTPAQVLDGLSPRGFRWAVLDARLFILKT